MDKITIDIVITFNNSSGKLYKNGSPLLSRQFSCEEEAEEYLHTIDETLTRVDTAYASNKS